MDRVEKQLLSFCVEALVTVQNEMRGTPVDRLIQGTPSGKADSLYLDVLPENLLKLKLIEEYDHHIVLVTEERGGFNYEIVSEAEIVVFSDPTDRSKQLRELIRLSLQKELVEPKALFGELIDHPDALATWEEVGGAPAQLTGACCSLTVVRRGEILISLILNYITQELAIAAPDLLAVSTLKDLQRESGVFKFSTWEPLTFRQPSLAHSYTTYLGKASYREHFEKAAIVDSTYRSTEEAPGGPARILYLSSLNPEPPGFILSNGEKIGEWIGWLGFCRYSQDLIAYSVYPGIFFAKDDILTTPSPPYSILELDGSSPHINYEKLKYFSNPSRYREMILVAHTSNGSIRAHVEANQSRVLFFR